VNGVASFFIESSEAQVVMVEAVPLPTAGFEAAAAVMDNIVTIPGTINFGGAGAQNIQILASYEVRS